MSICVVKLVGIETIIMVTVSWVFIYCLPRFGYSRLYLSVLLVVEQVRNAYRIFFHGGRGVGYNSTVLHGLTHLLLIIIICIIVMACFFAYFQINLMWPWDIHIESNSPQTTPLLLPARYRKIMGTKGAPLPCLLEPTYCPNMKATSFWFTPID